MVTLSRKSAHLLRTVRGQPHATADDHHETPVFSRPRSYTRDVAITAEPLSSDDDDALPAQRSTGNDFLQARKWNSPVEQAQASTFKRPQAVESPGSAASKRSLDEGPGSSDTDGMLFSSQGSLKKRKTSKGANIHAHYGKKQVYGQPKEGFKKPRQAMSKKDVETAEAPKPVQFLKAKGQDILEEGGRSVWRHSAGTSAASMDSKDISSPGSPLSSTPSTPNSAKVQSFKPPFPQPYMSTTECTICGQTVNRFLREDFENEFTPGKQLSFKWQQRFCIFHKQQEGRAVWIERGLPEVDWTGLEKRMRRKHGRLLDVIECKVASYHRMRLEERLKGRANTTMQVYNKEEGRSGAVVGYYGPRGEKMMTDHVLLHLSSRIRTQATRDKLVAAVGASGGVSGFVQAVVVPELAQQLVMEDLDIGEEKAREMIAGSAELGDLLHPEAEERVVEVVALED